MWTHKVNAVSNIALISGGLVCCARQCNNKVYKLLVATLHISNEIVISLNDCGACKFRLRDTVAVSVETIH